MSAALKTLYVLRHAKSSRDDPMLADHDRPLAPRGVRAGAAVAQHIRRARIRPHVVLCSSARRARETLAAIAGSLGDRAPVLVETELYGAGVAELLARLRRLDHAVASALLIGHNPALQDLVLTVAGDGDDDALASVRHKFPTAALATVGMPRAPWSDLVPGVAYLEALFLPRADRRPV